MKIELETNDIEKLEKDLTKEALKAIYDIKKAFPGSTIEEIGQKNNIRFNSESPFLYGKD